MSETSMSSSLKHCATCEFWSGPRKPSDSFMKYVRFDTTDKAQCLGKHKGTSKDGSNSCSSWKKWGVLR